MSNLQEENRALKEQLSAVKEQLSVNPANE
jgi:hypothetical protein